MADDNNQEQNQETTEVKGHVLSAEQAAEWGNDTRIIEPGVTDETGDQVRGNDAEEETKGTAVDDDETPNEEYEEPAPIVTAEDPGDFTPQDYSFEVTVYDDEGKNGKSVKINSIEQWEDLLDKDSNFGTPSAMLKAQRLATKMESNQERDHEKWQEKKESFDKQSEGQQARQDAVNNIANEITYLVSKGMLPDVAKEYRDVDWSDPEVAKQAGVKEQVALINYMRKENDTRIKAGLKPMTSVIDAYNSMQIEQRNKKATDVQKQAGEARKTAGARVAGTSPAPVSNTPKGIMVGRGGSLRDLDPGW